MAEYIDRGKIPIKRFVRSASVFADDIICSVGTDFMVNIAEAENKKLFEIINAIMTAPAADVVSKATIEQMKWERDTAIEQLKEYGVSFCEKKKDLVEVVRCKDCKFGVLDDPDFPKRGCFLAWSAPLLAWRVTAIIPKKQGC